MISPNSTILASDFISTSGGAGSVGKVPLLNAGGQIDTSFLNWKGVINSGQATQDMHIASGTFTIAHGLGVTPKLVKIFAIGQATNYAHASYSASGGFNTLGVTNGVVNTNQMGLYYSGGTDLWSASITSVDATNITITYTRSTSGVSGNAYFNWIAMA